MESPLLLLRFRLAFQLMSRIGLALSGGGFRAVVYHLGVVKFLRDAGILPTISHITSVSGGSVLGAHLVLNWDRYCGSEDEFQQAADEVLRFLKLDGRNRIVRRFPMASMVNIARRTLRMPTIRQFTRAGLLERHYEKHLYGDVSLFQLPDRPRLHILATNLSEGCLSSFYQGGLLLQRRIAGRRDRFERVPMGLATVPMAVAASSAFPGFFPPLELKAADVGADVGAFSRQSFTDGGIYDNIGLRMFRHIEQSWIRDIAPLGHDDILELDAVIAALTTAENLPEGTPLRRLSELVARVDPSHTPTALIGALWEVIQNDKLYRDESFRYMELTDPGAQSLLQYLDTSNSDPDLSDRVWLNRQIVETTLQQVIGKPCLRSRRDGFDQIFVSDAGAQFKVSADGRAGGLVRTALRSTDILMDRVNQLEMESFQNAPDVLFFPITNVVEAAHDPQAPHPEIQHWAARVRTDMDYFSDLECKALIQHGYCVARRACRENGFLDNHELANAAPWDPFATRDTAGGDNVVGPLNDKQTALGIARKLQSSSRRRIWSTLFDARDWPTWVWIPLIVIVLSTVPWLIYKANRHAQQQQLVLSAIAETSPLYRKILELLEDGTPVSVPAMTFKEVDTLKEPTYDGFEVVSDDRIFDLRGWANPEDKATAPYSLGRMRVRRLADVSENTHMQFQVRTKGDAIKIACRNSELRPRLFRQREKRGEYLWQLDFDFEHTPMGVDKSIVWESIMPPESASSTGDSGQFTFSIQWDTTLVRVWMLMPEGRNYDYFEIAGYPIDQPDQVEVVRPTTTVELPIGSIATFELINPKHNYRYEVRWRWESDGQE